MEVTCPNCESRFNLAEGVAKPNAKLRCSVCQNIFSINNSDADADTIEEAADLGGESLNLDDDNTSSAPEPKSKKSKIIAIILALIVLCGGGGAAWWYLASSADEGVKDPQAQAKSVELMTMRNVRQYYVQNEKVGSVFVIEGMVVNEFPVPKELIEVEAAIYGQDKAAMVVKKQLAGTVLSLFQLQVLGEEELESFLSNQIEILTKNTNVPTGGEVPFMVLFYNPPPDVAEFGVKIISAKDVEVE